MASVRKSSRNIQKVDRYGFDYDSDDENGSDNEALMEELMEDSVEEISLMNDSVENIITDDYEDSEWKFVDSESDTYERKELAPPDDAKNAWSIDKPNSFEEYVSTFLPDTLINMIVKSTNSRALIEEAESFIKEEDFNWTPVNNEEMRKFLGLVIIMGIVQKPTVHSYWSTEPIINMPIFSKIMSRNRFDQILKYIRFSDSYVKTSKASRLFELNNEIHRICNVYTPDLNLSLDESLVLFKGRLGFKMFIRIKRARFGVKIFYLCDAKGYTLSYQVYYGAESGLNGYVNYDGKPLLKSEEIVVRLLTKAGLLNKGYVVNIDNWYTSLRLVEYLYQQKTYVRGTIKANRGVPSVLKNKDVTKNHSCYVRKGPILITKFHDKKIVYLISTYDKAQEIEKRRFIPGGKTVLRFKNPKQSRIIISIWEG